VGSWREKYMTINTRKKERRERERESYTVACLGEPMGSCFITVED
jgi:hypothetical protein